MKRAVLLVALAVVGCQAKVPPAGAQDITPTSIKLSWTAPGDDSLTGRATSYDLRFSTSPITAANFGAATRFVGPAPSVAGARDSVVVAGLTPATTYHFAIKTADEVPNWSLISNAATATTLPPPDVTSPAAIRDLKIGGWLAKVPMLVGVRW